MAELAAALVLADMPSSPAPKESRTYFVPSSLTPFTTAVSSLSPLVHVDMAGSLHGSPAVYEGEGELSGTPMQLHLVGLVKKRRRNTSSSPVPGSGFCSEAERRSWRGSSRPWNHRLWATARGRSIDKASI